MWMNYLLQWFILLHFSFLFLIEIESMFVFGGCSKDNIATNNSFTFDTVSWKWSKVRLLLLLFIIKVWVKIVSKYQSYLKVI